MLLRKLLPVRHVTTRCLSDESIIREFNPKLNIKKTDILCDDRFKDGDPTRYRIPFLEDHEETLWNCTVGDQWNLGTKPGLKKGSDVAREKLLYPDVNVSPIKHFNYSGNSHLAERLRAGSLPMSYGRQLLGNLRRERPDKGLQAYINSKGRTKTINIGKSLGPPMNKDGFADESFESKIILFERRSQFFSSGMKAGFYTIAVVGNKNGLMGIAQNFSPKLMESMFKARDEAYQQLNYFDRYEGYTVPYAATGIYNRTKVEVVPHRSFGKNTANFYLKYMLDLAGYKGVTVKIYGRNCRQMMCKALITTLLSYETHEEQANRLGRHVVRFDRMHGYKPEVLASPRPGSIPVPITGEVAEVKGGPRPVKKELQPIEDAHSY